MAPSILPGSLLWNVDPMRDAMADSIAGMQPRSTLIASCIADRV